MAADIPNTFTTGGVISATRFNENFTYIVDRLWENNGSYLYYDSSYVGIGTATPESELHMVQLGGGTDNIQRIATFERASTGTTTAGYGSLINLKLETSAGTSTSAAEIGAVFIDPSDTTTKGAFIVKTKNNLGSTEKFRIDNLGDVGIGTQNPEGLLHLLGPADTRLKVETDYTGASSAYAVFERNETGQEREFWIGTGLTGTDSFDIWDQTAASFRLSINKDGKIGIGHTNPNHLLDLGTSTGPKLALYQLAGGDDFYGFGISSGLLEIHASSATGATAEAAMVIDNSGRVGIGKTSLSYPFDVYSSEAGKYVASIENGANTTGSHGLRIVAGEDTPSGLNVLISFFRPQIGAAWLGYIAQDGTGAVTYSTTSDQRLKENIADTRYSLDDLKRIKVRDFNWKKDKSKKRNTGFIAQELFEIYPNAVSKSSDDSNNWWAVDYGKLTPIIVKAIQDQQEMVETLKTENADLKSRIAALERN